MSQGAGQMCRLTIRQGTRMYCRQPGYGPDRASHDRNVLAMPSTAPGGEPAWSFRWDMKHQETYWYVLAEDVRDPEDFPDREGYEQ